MKIKNIYDSVGRKVNQLKGSISDYFGNSATYMKPTATSTPQQQPQQPQNDYEQQITAALRHLESSSGQDPDTPRNQTRSYTTVPANQNEQPRTIEYDVGYGGEWGLTPVALADMAGSRIDRDADPSTFTQYGRPLIPGMDPEEIQRELSTPEGAGRLAYKFFMSKRANKEDFTPQSLTDDYINLYVGKGGPSDTEWNRQRTLEYFTKIME